MLRLLGRRRPGRRRLLVLVTAATLASAALVGCAASAAPVAEEAALLRAYTTTVAAGSAHVTLAVHEREGTLARATSGSGVVSWSGQRSQLALTTTAAGLSSSTLTLVGTGDASYLQVPTSALVATRGRPWVRVASGAGGTGPVGALTLLDARATSALVVHPGTGADPSTEVRATVLPGHPAAGAGDPARAGLSAWVHIYGSSPVTLDVVVAGGGRVQRLELTTRSTVAAGTATRHPAAVAVGVSLELSQLGTPVTVTVPPPDEVSTTGLGPLLAGLVPGAT